MNLPTLLRRMERAYLITIFLLMVVLFFINILIRTLAPQSASDFAWIEEAVRLLNIFLVFGGLGLALERGRHVSIDSLREKLSAPLRQALYRCIDLIGLGACLYMTWLSFKLVRLVLGTGQRSPTLDIPMGWIYAAPLAGFALLSLRYALSLAKITHRRQAEASQTSVPPSTPAST